MVSICRHWIGGLEILASLLDRLRVLAHFFVPGFGQFGINLSICTHWASASASFAGPAITTMGAAGIADAIDALVTSRGHTAAIHSCLSARKAPFAGASNIPFVNAIISWGGPALRCSCQLCQLTAAQELLDAISDRLSWLLQDGAHSNHDSMTSEVFAHYHHNDCRL